MSKVWAKDSSANWKDYCLSYVELNGSWIPVKAVNRVVYVRNSSGSWNACVCVSALAWRALATHCETTARIVTTITGFSSGYSIDYAPTVDKVFVTNFTGNTVSVISNDVIVSTVTGITQPRTVIYDANTNTIYVINGGGTIYKINVSTYALSTFWTPGSTFYTTAMNYSTITQHFYIHNPAGGNIYEINEAGTIVRTIAGCPGVVYSEVDSAGNIWAVSGNGYGVNLVTLYFIVPSSGSVSNTYVIGTTPSDTSRKLAYDASRNHMYIPIQNQNVVVVYSTVTGPSAPITTLVFNHATGDALYVAAKDRVVLGARAGNVITIINPTNYSIQYEFSSTGGPVAVCYDTVNLGYYVANYDANSVSHILSTNPTQNTGNLIVDTQEQYDTGTLLSTGATSQNAVGQTTPPYIAPSVNTASCPLG